MSLDDIKQPFKCSLECLSGAPIECIVKLGITYG